MDVREKLVELLRNAKAAMKSENLSCDIARNMFVVDFMMANGVTVQEWISVKSRLPNEDEYTAKAKDGKEYYVRLLIAHKIDIIEHEIDYYDGYKWMTDMPIRLIKDVVAWMPFPNMPQPPKGE